MGQHLAGAAEPQTGHLMALSGAPEGIPFSEAQEVQEVLVLKVQLQLQAMLRAVEVAVLIMAPRQAVAELGENVV